MKILEDDEHNTGNRVIQAVWEASEGCPIGSMTILTDICAALIVAIHQANLEAENAETGKVYNLDAQTLVDLHRDHLLARVEGSMDLAEGRVH